MTKTETKAPQDGTIEAEGWRPQAGDILTGTVTEVSKAWSDYSDSFYPLLTIRSEEDGKLVSVHCFHEVLKTRMMELQPKVGDELSIACLGKRPTKDGKRDVTVYKVSAPGETGENVWADLGAQSRKAANVADSDIPPATDELPF